MSVSVKPQPMKTKDSYEPLGAAIHPVPADCADWLEALTPLGAAALRCQPYGVHSGFQECVLPITRPWQFDEPPAPGEPWDWLTRVLTRIEHKRLKPKQIERLAMMLAPGPRRLDGLPAYWPAAPNVGQTQAWSTQQRDGLPGRAVLTAAACDLQDQPLDHVSGRLLGLHDHETRIVDQIVPGDARRARAIREKGRRLLADLGAWPWTHVKDGRLPTDWRSRSEFVEPVRAWHEFAVSEREEECRNARVAFAQERWQPRVP